MYNANYSTNIGILKLLAWSEGLQGGSLNESLRVPGEKMEWIKSDQYTSIRLSKNHARRMSQLSKTTVGLALDVAFGYEIQHAVFSTRFGEIQNTVSLVEMLVKGEELSPTKFSQSVHNTSSGLFSIFGSTNISLETVSAGKSSFIAGFMSSIGHLKQYPTSNVLYVYSEESMPEVLASFNPDPSISPVGVAMILTLAESGYGMRISQSTLGMEDELISEPGNQVHVFLRSIFCGVSRFNIRENESVWSFNHISN